MLETQQIIVIHRFSSTDSAAVIVLHSRLQILLRRHPVRASTLKYSQLPIIRARMFGSWL